MTSARVGAVRLVSKRHSTGLVPAGAPISRATMQVTVTVPVLPAGRSSRSQTQVSAINALNVLGQI